MAKLVTKACPSARTMAVSWPLARPCRGQGRPCRSARLPCRSAHARTPARACAQRPSASPSYRGRGPRPCRRAQCRVAARPWPYRGRERAPGLRPACLGPQYIFLYCSQKISQPKPLSHNTSSVLRYTLCLAYPLPVAIQGLISQYNSLLAYTSCNTIWAVAKFHILCTKFSLSILIIIIIITFNYFQQLEKSPKSLKNHIYIYTLFFILK